nr:MAG TPA: hypothetical protein [Caudoviricetes sp.]
MAGTKKGGNGKSCQLEQSLLQRLHEMLPSQSKVYYIVWKYAKNLLPKKVDTFEDLTTQYQVFTDGMDEAHCERWLAEESVQAAVKYLLKRLHSQKLIELYEIYFDKAKEDVQAFQAFAKFSEKFFEDSGEDELSAILNQTKISEIE